MTARLYLLQRASAIVLVPLMLAHLATILWAARGGGISAAEILARTQGHAGWAAFYALLVGAAAVHGAIGIRTVLRELTPWRGGGVDIVAVTYLVGVLWLGARALAALT